MNVDEDSEFREYGKKGLRSCLAFIVLDVFTLISAIVAVVISIKDGSLTSYCLVPIVFAIVAFLALFVFNYYSWLQGERELYLRYFGDRHLR